MEEFIIIGKVSTIAVKDIVMSDKTYHWCFEKTERHLRIVNKLGGYGTALATFCIDKGHRDGKELHTLTSNGIILIQNYDSREVVTVLIARSAQYRRYYKQGCYPSWMWRVLSVCNKNEKNHENY